jgi:cyclopropane fatty-acyl-phospholipid synthase-like methyltransferase
MSRHAGGIRSAVISMDNRWEAFAKQNAEFYIKTASDVDFATPRGQELFRQWGRDDVARILREAAPHLNGRNRAIEIGCGIGRLAIPTAEQFTEVIGVDIAPTMVDKLRDHCRAAGVTNVRGFLSAQPWDEQGPADLVYSLIVFQHIASAAVIADYFARIARCLAGDGVCYAHFDTRPRTMAYRARQLMPDLLLPKTYRKGIRRVRRGPADLRAMFLSCGLTVADELRPGTDDHVFLLRRQDAG